MRYTAQVALFVCLGALMTAAAPTAAQQKDEKPKAPWDQLVKVEGTDKHGKAFVFDNVPARRAKSKAPQWIVYSSKVNAQLPFTGVVITDGEGKKYKIKSSELGAPSEIWCRIE
ncbi:MAG TPA: hypothetical protein VH092_30835 [Urbifossiella sp.]|nr:hypothetical protein [Urbifossiella sp.]